MAISGYAAFNEPRTATEAVRSPNDIQRELSRLDDAVDRLQGLIANLQDAARPIWVDVSQKTKGEGSTAAEPLPLTECGQRINRNRRTVDDLSNTVSALIAGMAA